MKGNPLAMLCKKLLILGVLITGVVTLGTRQATAQNHPNPGECVPGCSDAYQSCLLGFCDQNFYYDPELLHDCIENVCIAAFNSCMCNSCGFLGYCS